MTKGDQNTIYNIGGGIPINFREAIELAWAKTGSRSEIVNIQSSDFHKVVQSKSFFMCTEKLQRLGFTPKYTMESMIDSLL